VVRQLLDRVSEGALPGTVAPDDERLQFGLRQAGITRLNIERRDECSPDPSGRAPDVRTGHSLNTASREHEGQVPSSFPGVELYKGERLGLPRSALHRERAQRGAAPLSRYTGRMRGDYQADLDDLISRCRPENTKRSFAEAVACYRAGAYRACIVSTWTSVLFDYLGKLRELELTGNAEAEAIVRRFDVARGNHHIRALLEYEAKALDDAAGKFELLTPTEKQDLERLRDDRNRCAHPSMLTLDDPYAPTAELARSHMRNAVEHMLSRPPLQGREALARLWAAVNSNYFPDDDDDAARRLAPQLAQARPALVRSLLSVLTKRLLAEDDAKHEQLYVALRAVITLKHEEAERFLREKLSTFAERLEDADLPRLVRFCGAIVLAWGTLSAPAQDRLRLYVQRSDGLQGMILAFKVPALWQVAQARIPALPVEDLVRLAALTRDEACLEQIVRHFETSTRYVVFRDLRKALQDERLRLSWTLPLQVRLLDALVANMTLRSYDGYDGTARDVLSLMGTETAGAHLEKWQVVYDVLVARSWLPPAEGLREALPGLRAPAGVADGR
jgi:hypothetical protein